MSAMLPVQPGKTYSITISFGAVLTQIPCPDADDEVRLVPVPPNETSDLGPEQKWKVEDNGGNVAFRNLSNNKFLRAASDGSIAASATELSEEDMFLFGRSAEGTIIGILQGDCYRHVGIDHTKDALALADDPVGLVFREE